MNGTPVLSLHRLAAACATIALIGCAADAAGPNVVYLRAHLTASGPIVSVAEGDRMPLQCEAWDRYGFRVTLVEPVVSASRIGPTALCSEFRVTQSGRDTLVISAGDATVRVPVAVAIRPTVSPPEGEFLTIDSVPTGAIPWLLSARRNSRGQVEVYTGMVVDPNGDPYEDLHRYVSDDNGVTFRYDGVVLRHDAEPCSLNGFGMENVEIVERADGPGWRMYFSSGQFYCYGWQVFSAVSTDERNWTIEPGIRLSNTADGQPAENGPIPWPVGEGFAMLPRTNGDWRMLVGGNQHILPPWGDLQIVEWVSPDQLNWTYVDTVITTRRMPLEGQGAIYSPTIREFAPGLWRMIFAAEDFRDVVGRASIWSAVSTDLHSWQLEGPLIYSQQSNYFDASLVDDLLLFVREDSGLPPFVGDPELHHLAGARVIMP